MILSAIAWTIASSAILYVFTPRMPFYQVISPRLVSVAVSSFSRLELSATILAGVTVENWNFAGVDVHSALVDIYYPDWNGLLQHIGYLKDNSNALDINEGSMAATNSSKNSGEKSLVNKNKNRTSTNITNENKDREESLKTKKQPFIKLQPRNITASDEGMISIFIQGILPHTYLNMLKDVLKNWGKLEILSSGVIHINSSPGVALSLGVVCDNTLDLFSIPLRIIGRDCKVDSLKPGWTSIFDHSEKIRNKTMGIL